MTRKGYTEEQLIAALQPAEAGGRPVSQTPRGAGGLMSWAASKAVGLWV
jgi:hypothetical protein